MVFGDGSTCEKKEYKVVCERGVCNTEVEEEAGVAVKEVALSVTRRPPWDPKRL